MGQTFEKRDSQKSIYEFNMTVCSISLYYSWIWMVINRQNSWYICNNYYETWSATNINIIPDLVNANKVLKTESHTGSSMTNHWQSRQTMMEICQKHEKMMLFLANPYFFNLLWTSELSKIKTKQKIEKSRGGSLANNPKNKKMKKKRKCHIFFEFSDIKIFCDFHYKPESTQQSKKILALAEKRC